VKNFKWQMLVTGMCALALAVGCDDKTDTGDDSGTAAGNTPGGGVPGDGPGDGGDDTGGGGTPGGDEGTPGDGGADTGLFAIAIYMSGVIDPGSTGDIAISGEFTGANYIDGFGVDGGYVDFATNHCTWGASNSVPATPSDCPDCEYSFDVSFDTEINQGDNCALFDAALPYYGFTGPEVFIFDTQVGFLKVGSGSYNGSSYDYGYMSFYFGYPYYYWAATTTYSAFSYDNYYDATLTDMVGINGYYGIEFTL